MMLSKKKYGQAALWKYTLSAPLFVGMLILSSATFGQSEPLQVITKQAEVILSTPAVPQGMSYKATSPEDREVEVSEVSGDSGSSVANHKVGSAISKSKSQTVDASEREGSGSYLTAIQDTSKKAGNRVIVGTVTPKQDSSGSKLTLRIKCSIPADLNAKVPLYLVNGKEIDDISKINPNDIARIDVLKGDKALEKYGVKADNGVIEITLKEQ